MRNRHLILLLSILLATFLVAGCGSQRQLTKDDTDQFNAISGKIAQAEGMTPGAKVCAPKELAFAKAEKDLAYHEATESWENVPMRSLPRRRRASRPSWNSRRTRRRSPPESARP
jgi:hypothetical protein